MQPRACGFYKTGLWSAFFLFNLFAMLDANRSWPYAGTKIYIKLVIISVEKK
jgi:hypothetical protein